MLKRVLVLAMVAGVMVFAGCGEKGGGSGGSSSGRVAVVDLDKILADIGQKSRIDEASQVLERNLQLSVQVLQQNVQIKLSEELEKIGKQPEAKIPAAPTDPEKKLLKEWIGKMRGLEQVRLDASNKIRQAVYQKRRENQQTVQKELSEIGKRIKPLAKQIAKAKGLDVVAASGSVFAYDDAVDITAEVFKAVSELQKAGNFPAVKIPEPLKVTRTPAPTTAPADGTTPKAP